MVLLNLKTIKMDNNITVLKAMLLMTQTLNYSSTYTEQLKLEIMYMIDNENNK